MEGQEIRQLRRRAGLTQEALAERLDVDQGTISRWERGIERPRPHSAGRLRDLLMMDAATMVQRRQLAMIRHDMVAGTIHDSSSRLAEVSGRAARFYRRRDGYDIARDSGKTFEEMFLERGGTEAWAAFRQSGLLDGSALLLRLFVSGGGMSHLSHYEPVIERGSVSGFVAYVMRMVAEAPELPEPRLRHADVLRADEAGTLHTLYRGEGADLVMDLLCRDFPD